MPTIVPGAGWSGATAQPATQGSPSDFGYYQPSIARWDVVPFQTFSSTFTVGVVAEHVCIGGIDRVEFAADGGSWVSVSTPSTNPITGVLEYCADLNPADFSSGDVVEVRAIAYPVAGIPLVLQGVLTGGMGSGIHSMYLNADPGGTLPALVRYVSPSGSDSNNGLTAGTPFLTTNKAAFSITQAQGNSDGGIVYLLPGTYVINSAEWFNNSNTVNRWMTVRPAPTYTKADVTISGSTGSGFNSKLIRFKDVTFTGGVNTGGAITSYVWVDDCQLDGPGRLVGSISFGQWSGTYINDSQVQDVNTGLQSFQLIRNCGITTIAGDSYSNSGLVINATVADQDRTGGGDIHADIYQNTNPGYTFNVILYNVVATDSILNSAGIWQCEGSPSSFLVKDCQIGGSQGDIGGTATWTNIYIKNSTLRAAYTGPFTADDFVFEGVEFTGGNPGAYTGITFRDNIGGGSLTCQGLIVTTLTLP